MTNKQTTFPRTAEERKAMGWVSAEEIAKEEAHASEVGDIVEFKYDYERIGKVIRFFNHSFGGQRMVEIEYMDESGNVQRIDEEVSRTWK